MDADYASLGEELRARQEEYRRSQRDSDSRGFSGVGLTGVDPRTNGSGSTEPSQNGFHWTSPSFPATPPVPQPAVDPGPAGAPTPSETPTTNGSPTATNPTASVNGSLFTAPSTSSTSSAAAPASTGPHTSGRLPAPDPAPAENQHSQPGNDSLRRHSRPDETPEHGHRIQNATLNPSPQLRTTTAEPSPQLRNTTAEPEPALGNPAAEPSPRTRSQDTPGRRRAKPDTERSPHTEPRSGAAPTELDVRLIMHLLLASDRLGTLAAKAESGEASIQELAQAARTSRSAALAVVSAWYGGTDQMVEFAQALLQAAAETD